jgi:site-specific DNA-methyltransferase (adenine-specific)
LIKGFTDEGDTVLDCFFGSGTTAVACQKTNRNFIGYEITPKYYEMAQLRVAEAIPA